MKKITSLFAIAAIASFGMTACEEKKPDAPAPKKEASAPDPSAPAPSAPSAPTAPTAPKKPATTDEVINAAPEAAPAPAPKPPAPAPAPDAPK
jgi:translation initiation factor IF-2